MAHVLGSMDSLHFNVLEGIHEEDAGGNFKQYRISVALTDDKGSKTGKEIKFVVRAINTKVAFEMIETFAQQVKDLSVKQFDLFKETHKFTFFHALLNQIDDQEIQGGEARRVILYKPNRMRDSLERVFGKKFGDVEIYLSNRSLKEIKEYSKMMEGKIKDSEDDDEMDSNTSDDSSIGSGCPYNAQELS